jgi:hypothetical protein
MRVPQRDARTRSEKILEFGRRGTADRTVMTMRVIRLPSAASYEAAAHHAVARRRLREGAARLLFCLSGMLVIMLPSPLV